MASGADLGTSRDPLRNQKTCRHSDLGDTDGLLSVIAKQDFMVFSGNENQPARPEGQGRSDRSQHRNRLGVTDFSMAQFQGECFRGYWAPAAL